MCEVKGSAPRITLKLPFFTEPLVCNILGIIGLACAREVMYYEFLARYSQGTLEGSHESTQFRMIKISIVIIHGRRVASKRVSRMKAVAVTKS